MVLITPHQRFILDVLPTNDEPDKELDIKEFFIKFGFTHRETAERALEKAVNKLAYLNIVTIDQQEYLKEVYIDNEFKEVLDTEMLNEYWKATERVVEKENILKRKPQQVIQKLVIPERSPKERRISVNTTKNNIYDLSNAGPSGQTTTAFNNVKNSTKTVSTPLPDLPSYVKDSIMKVFKKTIQMHYKYNILANMALECSSDDALYYKLLTHIVESHILSPNLFILSHLKGYSEMDLSLLFWGRVFLLLFSNCSNLIIKSGEKRLEDSTFKIDYKIGCIFKGSFLTLSCIEIGKFVEDAKVRDDHHKLLLESKVIINNIIKKYQYIDPKSIPIVGLQICGLKGDFIQTILGNKKSYITHRPLERLRTPLNCIDPHCVDTFLRQLLYYRDYLTDLWYDINQMINEDDDKRASFGRSLNGQEHKPDSFLDWIDDKVKRL